MSRYSMPSLHSFSVAGSDQPRNDAITATVAHGGAPMWPPGYVTVTFVSAPLHVS
jgi:hypothetical protein